MTAPVVHALRTHYGDEAQIDFITLNKFKGAAELIPGIDTIYTVEKSTIEIRKELKENNYDYLIDLHSNIRSRSLARGLNIMTFRVNKMAQRRLSLVLGLVKKPVDHYIDRSLKLLDPFSIKVVESNPWGGLNCKKPEAELPDKYIAIAAGATYEGKKIPESTLDQTISSLDEKFIIVGGSDMSQLGESLQAKHNDKVINLCGKLSLMETAHVMKNSLVALGGDTGAMHIATAVGAALVSVWGCTRPSLGLAPWRANTKSMILEPQGRGSRPCSRHGDKCRFKRKGQNLCINHVSPEAIIDAIKSLFK